MNEEVNFNTRYRTFQAWLNVIYKIFSGFVLGAGIVGLALLIIPTGLILELIILGGIFACLWGIKEAVASYKRYQLEKQLAQQLSQLSADDESNPLSLPFAFDYGPKHPWLKQLLGWTYLSDKMLLKVTNTIFSVLTVGAIFIATNPLLLSTLSVGGVALMIVTPIAILLTLAHVVESAHLKARIKNIHRVLSPFTDEQTIALLAEDDLDTVFKLTSTREKFVYTVVYPVMEGITQAIAVTGSSFGIIVLLGIDFGLMLPVIAMPALIGVAIAIGVVAGLIAATRSFRINQFRINYINYAHIRYNELKDQNTGAPDFKRFHEIPSLSQFKAEEQTLMKKIPTEKPTSRLDKFFAFTRKLAHKMSPKLDKLAQIINGAGVGTAFVITVFTVLATLSIFINPLITIGLILFFGVAFAGINVYRLNHGKNDQCLSSYKMIDELRKPTDATAPSSHDVTKSLMTGVEAGDRIDPLGGHSEGAPRAPKSREAPTREVATVVVRGAARPRAPLPHMLRSAASYRGLGKSNPQPAAKHQ